MKYECAACINPGLGVQVKKHPFWQCSPGEDKTLFYRVLA